MSTFAGARLLDVLDRWHAFNPVPLPGYRTQLYTPFQTLIGSPLEARIRDAFRATRKVALSGPMGSGKSSVFEYLTSIDADGIAPIWVAVNHESEEILKDPTQFARHLIRQIVRWARDSEAMAAEERHAHLLQTAATLPTSTRSTKTDLSLTLALHWLKPGISREISETVADPAVERSGSDFIESLDRLVDLIRQDLKLTPVLLLDDSDRWLRISGRVREPLLNSFFLDTCRMLAERNWAVGMAIHPEYQASNAFREAVANGYFALNCDMPRFETPVLLRSLIDARVRSVCAYEYGARSMELGRVPVDPPPNFEPESAFEEGFESVLYDYYSTADYSSQSADARPTSAIRGSWSQRGKDLHRRTRRGEARSAVREVRLDLRRRASGNGSFKAVHWGLGLRQPRTTLAVSRGR